MPMPTMHDTKQALSSEDIDAVEQRLGIKLPGDYRAWLLKHNGGRPEPAGFRYKLKTGLYTDSAVAWFLAIHDGRFSNFERETRWRKAQNRLPGELVAIARDPFGNLICMSFGGADKGKIYFWDHEEEGPEPSYDNCHLIADSLQEFLEGLH
jgi:cell wall assembly regulator SMI1